MSLLSRITATLLDILFPPCCLVCTIPLRGEGRALFCCAACFASIPISDTLTCPVCHGRLPENKKTCHPAAPYLLAAITHYDNAAARSLIWQLKYQHRTSTLTPLTELMRRFLTQLNFDFSSYHIVPIPLHPKKKRERGFNQSALLAIELSKLIHRPIISDALARVRFGAPQIDVKDHKARAENISNAFAVTAPEKISGQNILLVDDVSTSGATLTEATRILKDAGAKTVIGLVILRAR